MDTNLRPMGALRIVLIGLLASWVLFIFGIHSMLSSSIYDESASVSESFEPATYFFLAAVAIFGFASLYAKRKAQALIGSGDPKARPVYYHAFSALIVATAIAVWAVIVIFVVLLGTDYTNASARILNTYLPIVLFTALVVLFLVSGFVFGRTSPPHVVSAPAQAAEQPEGPRIGALAYAVPIIGAAIAAITAGVIYDLTGTSLTAWLWVLVFTILAVGITVGTFFSSRLPRTSGARGLNFAWVVAFTVVGSIMAFVYGGASTDYLNLNSGLTMDAYAGDSPENSIEANGYDLEPRSEVTLTLEPEGENLDTFNTDSDGWFYQTYEFPVDTSAGEHTVTLVGVARDGTELDASITFTTDGSEITLKDAERSDTDEVNRSLPVTLDWIVTRAAPPFILLVLVSALLHVTLPLRARSVPERRIE